MVCLLTFCFLPDILLVLSMTSSLYTGIFLHILADTLGSVGVIISSALIISLVGTQLAAAGCSVILTDLILSILRLDDC